MRPYDRLIEAALDGSRLPFARQDAVEAAWRVVDPALGDVVPIHRYPGGSWGPRRPTSSYPTGSAGTTPRTRGSWGAV
jgi:glucose-6-phosphate 1-dehydrogenase